MTIVFVLFVIMAGFAGYLAIGFLARRYTMPRAIARAYQHNRDDLHYPEKSSRSFAISDVRIDGIANFTLWLWPVMVPYYALSGRRTIESYAPWAAEERARKAERQIAELEQELSIGKDER